MQGATGPKQLWTAAFLGGVLWFALPCLLHAESTPPLPAVVVRGQARIEFRKIPPPPLPSLDMLVISPNGDHYSYVCYHRPKWSAFIRKKTTAERKPLGRMAVVADGEQVVQGMFDEGPPLAPPWYAYRGDMNARPGGYLDVNRPTDDQPFYGGSMKLLLSGDNDSLPGYEALRYILMTLDATPAYVAVKESQDHVIVGDTTIVCAPSLVPRAIALADNQGTIAIEYGSRQDLFKKTVVYGNGATKRTEKVPLPGLLGELGKDVQYCNIRYGRRLFVPVPENPKKGDLKRLMQPPTSRTLMHEVLPAEITVKGEVLYACDAIYDVTGYTGEETMEHRAAGPRRQMIEREGRWYIMRVVDETD